MNTIECIKSRRSIRTFSDKPVSHSLIENIIDAASFSPSWKNTQIARYLAIENPILKSNISVLTPSYNQKIIESAPLLIAITIIKNRSGFERDGSFSTIKKGGWQMFDAGIATQTFCLAAHESGISTVIMGIMNFEKITELLVLPEDRELIALVAAGYAAEEPVSPKRKTVEDLLIYL